jgi:hypothetical protein
MHRELLSLQLERLQLLDEQIAKLNGMIAQALKPQEEAVARLAEVPGFGVDSAQQVISEVGVRAKTFPSAAQLTSWVGTCPGKEESAEENHNSRSAKGNRYLAGTESGGPRCGQEERQLLPRRYSAGCCLDWATSLPFGPSPIGSAAWFGRSCMREFDSSNKVWNAIPSCRSIAPGVWHEPCASSVTTSKSLP